MKNKSYWQKRAENVSNYEFEKADNYKLKLEEEYKKALKSIQDDIEVFYSKFANDNKISISEAKKILARDELRDFKITLKEFIEKAKDNKNLQWENELNNLSNKIRITRLESLQAQIRNEIENLYIKQQESSTGVLEDIYKDTYYRNIYEIHKGLGLVVSFTKLDTNIINTVLTEPWHGNNYSSRIWNNKELLIKELQHNLTQAFIRGDSIDKTSKIIAKRMNVAIGRARTLVNTESAYIASKATLSSYSASGIVKKYEILATLDLHTSKICRSLDGKVFDLSDKKIGVNAPPFHPNCRTTIIPYFDDAVDEERIARNADGRNYYVDGNIKYSEWYNKYVKGNLKEEIAEKKIKNKSSDKKQHEIYKNILGNMPPKIFADFQNLKYNNTEEWNSLKQNFIDTNRYNKIVSEANNLNIKGIPIKLINRIDISEYEFDYEHINNERQHGVTKEMAQEFINSSKAAYNRWNGQVTIYISESGCSVVNLKDKKVSTSYKNDEYDDKFRKLMEVLKND